MKRRQIRKLTISRETLRRLEGDPLRKVAGGATNERSVCVCQTDQDTICICITDLCITDIYTNCNLCDS
jgi:hypothetical protein